MIKAILFDSDGVLVDSEKLFFEATRAAFTMAGITLSTDHWARLYLGEGKRSRDIAKLLGMDPAIIEATIERRDDLFKKRIEEGVSVFPNVRETLDQLAGHFRLAVVTGASRGHYDRVHSSTGLAKYFKIVVASDDCEYVKPHPQAYLVALERLDLKSDECIAVEDSPRGAAAAMSAAIRCFVIPTQLTDVSLCPPGCEILNDIKELKKLAAIIG